MQVYDIPIGENKKEETLHGSYEFPMEIYETKLCKNILGFINWHWHDELQFCFITEGRVSFYVNSENFTLNKGEGIYINKGILHMAKPLSGNDSSYICIDTDARLFSLFSGSIIELKYVNPFIGPAGIPGMVLRNEEKWQINILKKLKTIHKCYIKREYGYEIKICTELLSIWRLLILNSSAEIQNKNLKMNTDYIRMKDIMDYIHLNYFKKITLEMIADTVHLSKHECCRFFKRMSNTTIFDYLIDYRITRAIELLHFSNFNISQIAYEVGFSSTSFFIYTFKRKTSCTPAEYRVKNVKNKK